MKKIILYCMAVFLMLFSSGCDRIEVENQLSNKQADITSLRSRNQQLSNEIKGYSAQIARLNAKEPDGMFMEELRKALNLKSSNLQDREDQIKREEESLRQAIVQINKLQRHFYAETGEKMEAIGEARQIKKEYESISAALTRANERANNWLIYISVLVVAFVVSVFFVIFTGMRYSRQNKDIDAAVVALNTEGGDVRSKLVIASCLGRKIDFKDNAD